MALTAIVSAVLLVFAAYSYSTESGKRWQELQRVLNISADQLALGVALPAWNLDENQVLAIMRASMNQRDLHAIVMYASGSKRAFVVQRGPGDTLETGQPLSTTPDMLVAQRPILVEGTNIGTVKVFVTPARLHQELRELRHASLLVILLLAAVLVASVYGLLWFLILRPLKAVGQYLAGDTPQRAWYVGELRTLKETIHKMWDLLDSRYRAMRESEERLSVATRAARIGIWDWDVLHDELAQDDEVLRQYGQKRRLDGGNYKAWLECVVPEDRARARAEVAAALNGERDFSLQFRIRRPDGTLRHLRSMARSFRDERGKVVRMVGVSIDVTEATEGELELRRHRSHLEELVAERTEALSVAVADAQSASRTRSVFLSAMRHDLHAPLNSVIGFSRLMTNSSTMSAEEKRNMATIHSSAQQLLTLINDILELARIEAGEVGLHREAVDAAQLLRDVGDMIGERAAKAGVALKLECLAPPRAVMLDGAKLRQVLLNLAASALKTERPGDVTLALHSTSLPGGRHGLAFAVRMERDRAVESNGLGLAISRQYVRIMGGELEMQDVPGQGAQLHFTIEAEEAGAGVVPASLPRLAPRDQGRRVLVADGSADSRHLLRSMLAPAGFEVHEASSGPEALDAIAQLQPDLALLDWRMPGSDGLETTRRLRGDRSLPQPRVVLMVSPNFGDERQQALAAGADDVLAKPVEQGKLFRMLQQQLGLDYVEGVLP